MITKTRGLYSQSEESLLAWTLNKIGFSEMIVKLVMLTETFCRRESDMAQGLSVLDLSDKVPLLC